MSEHLSCTQNGDFQLLNDLPIGTFGLITDLIRLEKLVWAVVESALVSLPDSRMLNHGSIFTSVQLSKFLLDKTVVKIEVNFGVRLHRMRINFSVPKNLKFALLDDVDILRLFALIIDNLISVIFSQHEREYESLNLFFGPMLKRRHLLEKHYFLFDLLVFDFLEDALVFISTKDGKAAIFKSRDGCCSRFVVYEGQLSETMTLFESKHLYEPLESFVLFNLNYLFDHVIGQFYTRFKIKSGLLHLPCFLIYIFAIIRFYHIVG